MMVILESSLLNTMPGIGFGFSTIAGSQTGDIFRNNLSFSVGDNKQQVQRNREVFSQKLGIEQSHIAYQMQIHSDKVTLVSEPGLQGESDAMITNKKDIGLAISAADCVPIFLYDPNTEIIAGVHAGWRSTQKQILAKTITLMIEKYDANPKNFVAYIGPSISQKNYQVRSDVAKLFHPTYRKQHSNGIYLDVSRINYEILRTFKVSNANIQRSALCTFEMSNVFHSYRRDKENSGRALGILYMKD